MSSINEYSFSSAVKRHLRDGFARKRMCEAGHTGQEVVGYSDAAMERLYLAAQRLLANKHCADAADAFLFLVGLNPRKSSYWLGLGMASQMNRDFETAVDAYELAAIGEIDCPVPYLYLGKCFFALHEREAALDAFSLAVEYAADHPDYRELKTAALRARDLLLRERTGS